jgi:hypothetical protein
VKEWLQRHPRWTFHFTPTSASWLNTVEGYFAKLARRRLLRGVFRSVVELQAAIKRSLQRLTPTRDPFGRQRTPTGSSPPSKEGTNC